MNKPIITLKFYFLVLLGILCIISCKNKVLDQPATFNVKEGMYNSKPNARLVVNSINIEGDSYESRSILTDGNTLNSKGEKGKIILKRQQYFLVADSILVSKQNPTSKDLILTIRSARMGGPPGNQVYEEVTEYRERIFQYCACNNEDLIRCGGKCFARTDKQDFIERDPKQSQSSLIEKKCQFWDDVLAK